MPILALLLHACGGVWDVSVPSTSVFRFNKAFDQLYESEYVVLLVGHTSLI